MTRKLRGSALVALILLAGCVVVPPPVDNPPPPPPPVGQTPTAVMTVNNVSLLTTRSFPPQLVIRAEGTTRYAGWSNPTLDPVNYVQAPPDGIYDYTFRATPPPGIAAQVLTPIDAQLNVGPVPNNMRGVRIHAELNDCTAFLDGRPTICTR